MKFRNHRVSHPRKGARTFPYSISGPTPVKGLGKRIQCAAATELVATEKYLAEGRCARAQNRSFPACNWPVPKISCRKRMGRRLRKYGVQTELEQTQVPVTAGVLTSNNAENRRSNQAEVNDGD